LKISVFSSFFYIVNICGFAFGAYLVLAYSLYRILLLYCLFNILLLWIIDRRFAAEWSSFRRPENSKYVTTGLAFVLIVLLFVLIIGNYGSIYARPSFISPLIALSLVLGAILPLATIGDRGRSFFTSSYFLLPVMISITLIVNFSIYLVQPNPFARPLFATVDAYRDFANAARIVKLSGFRPEDMVLQTYYAEFPVVPILISILSIMGALPIEEGQIILAVTFEILGVVGVWLMSTAVVRKFQPAFASSAGVLAVILVWLQPYFIEPGFYLTPLRFSVSLLVLIMYLLYRPTTSSRLLSSSFLISILILVMVIVPMHPTSAFVVLVFCILAALLVPRDRRLHIDAVVIGFVAFSLYLFSGAALAFTSLLHFMGTTYSVAAEILSHGPSIISEAAASGTIVRLSELGSFMEILPLALMLSVCTVCVLQSYRVRGDNSPFHRLNSLHLAFGILVFAGLIGGYLSSFFGLNMRYFAFPLTPLLVVACAVVLSWALKSLNTSRIRGLILFGLIIVYAFSMAGSPYVLYETSPTQARLIPTVSESAAAQFVSANMQSWKSPNVSQILSDWPFYDYVQGLIYSRSIGIEKKIDVVELMWNSPTRNAETFVILRQYYLQNLYLEEITPHTGGLKDVDAWNSPNYNKIYDSSTTCVYLGQFEG
jgi:hypothetical protein